MFGSDWPAFARADSYEQVMEALHYFLGAVRDAEAAQVCGGNTTILYRLDWFRS
jgi:predicted TIM-barrel fold metal-dependent hydrolase